MAQVLGPLLKETWIEFSAPGFCLVHSQQLQHLKSKLVNEGSVCLSVRLSNKYNKISLVKPASQVTENKQCG